MKRLIIVLLTVIVIVCGALFIKSYFFVTHKSQQFATIKKIENKQITMKITSTVFENQAKVPAKYTCTGESINPPLTISDVPANTKSLALIMDDPDAPMGTFVHWVVYNIDPKTREIAENTQPQGTEGFNGAGKQSYIGPCPPAGTHRYFFKLYALDTLLDFAQTPDKKALEEKMQGHIIDQAELIGQYSK